MRFAVIEELTGTVINVVEAAEGYIAGRGVLTVASDTANIGDHYEEGNFLKDGTE